VLAAGAAFDARDFLAAIGPDYLAVEYGTVAYGPTAAAVTPV